MDSKSTVRVRTPLGHVQKNDDVRCVFCSTSTNCTLGCVDGQKLGHVRMEQSGDGLISFRTYNCTYILKNRAYFFGTIIDCLNVYISKKYALTLKAKKMKFLVICLV